MTFLGPCACVEGIRPLAQPSLTLWNVVATSTSNTKNEQGNGHPQPWRKVDGTYAADCQDAWAGKCQGPSARRCPISISSTGQGHNLERDLCHFGDLTFRLFRIPQIRPAMHVIFGHGESSRMLRPYVGNCKICREKGNVRGSTRSCAFFFRAQDPPVGTPAPEPGVQVLNMLSLIRLSQGSNVCVRMSNAPVQRVAESVVSSV